MWHLKIYCVALICFIHSISAIKLDPFSYTCDEYSRCVRGKPAKPGSGELSLTECKFTCLKNALLWPLPKEPKTGKTLTSFHPDNVGFANKDYYGFDIPAVEWLEEASRSRSSSSG